MQNTTKLQISCIEKCLDQRLPYCINTNVKWKNMIEQHNEKDMEETFNTILWFNKLVEPGGRDYFIICTMFLDQIPTAYFDFYRKKHSLMIAQENFARIPWFVRTQLQHPERLQLTKIISKWDEQMKIWEAQEANKQAQQLTLCSV